MKIKEFAVEMAEELRDILGSEYIVEYKEITKNNAAVYHALLIKKTNENIAPTIYIDGYYDDYENGTAKTTLVKEILRMYEAHALKEPFDDSVFTDFSKACTHLTFKVVSYAKNKKMLFDIPYKRLQDLALIPICLVENAALGEGNIVIRNEHLKAWEISFDELWENVYEYAEKTAPVTVENIFDVVNEIEESFSFMDGPAGMMVVSNKQKMNGAASIFYPGMLDKMARELGGDLVILPSSIHETIVFKAPQSPSFMKSLVRMVREVNATVVSDEEILSENVYLYDHRAKELTIYGE